MPQLVFNDGSTREVTAAVASRILAILDCREQPENEAQARYVESITDVRPDPVPDPAATSGGSDKSSRKRAAIDAINADPAIRGADKIKAITQVLKESKHGRS